MSTVEQIQAAQKAELESMVDIADKAMSGFEKFAQLNLQALRDSTQEAAESMRAALSARDLQELLSLQSTGSLQNSTHKAMAYAQRMAEIAGSTQAELTEALNQSMARMQAAMRDSVRNTVVNLPAGSEGAAALMQSALNFTAQAFDALQKSQAQAAKLLTDNVKNATQAAADNAAPATPARRKRAA